MSDYVTVLVLHLNEQRLIQMQEEAQPPLCSSPPPTVNPHQDSHSIHHTYIYVAIGQARRDLDVSYTKFTVK